MSDISAVTSGTAVAAAGAGTGRTETLDYDSFLKLLIAQMKNQDPLNPMDSTEYVAQLASFSNVEQGLKMNTKLDRLLLLSSMSQANNAVGQKLTSADGTVTGLVASVRVDEDGATATLVDGRHIKIESGVSFGAL